MGKIIQLPKNVINQIAAGEVIERPYSVVKELVENSIDADATKISIEISNACRNIRIADNGCGIEPDDILLAFSKHATSKIKTGDDLYAIKTMGFRGEALASIISISKLTCTTRTKDSDTGIRVECENSEVKQANTGCAVGTIMEVRDLFYNIPARLKFLKSDKTEFAYISELIQSLSLAHTNIAFELKNNGKTTLKTTGQSNTLFTVSELFSDDVVKNLKEIEPAYDKLSGLELKGYVSTPDYTRASKKDYYMFVNSRVVKCSVIQKAIDTVYKNLIGNSRYPFIILELKVPSQDIDVNVHPTKKEVKYKNANQIFNFIYTNVNKALSLKRIEPNQESNKEIENINKENEESYVSFGTDFSELIDKTVIHEVPNCKNEQKEVKIETSISEKNDYVRQTSLLTQKQESFLAQQNYIEEDVIIGQYKKTYILIEKEEGLEIVDQHIAEERYIYEKLKKTRNIDCQLLFLSDIIEISPSDKELLENNKDKLNKFGYEIDFISEKEVIFRKIFSKVSPKEILADLLEHMAGDINNIEEEILITTSCKAAVKANTYLTQFQMQEIIRNWRTCEQPYTCPHGRPISKILEHKDIAKFFQRTK